jgi:hypothetical protein
MRQKITWTPYILFGISSFFAVVFFGCKKEIDYKVSADFIYINETAYSIEVISERPFILPPMSKHLIMIEGDGEKEVSPESFVPPFLDGIIIYDNVKCDTLLSGQVAGQGEGPTGIQNYISRIKGKRYFEFTYTFTLNDYIKSEECN